MKYIRTKDGVYENEGFWGSSVCLKGHRSVPLDQMIRQADTIEELIMEDDLVMAKDYWEPESKKSHVTIIDPTLFPIKEGTVDELYIKQENGDYKLVAKKKPLERGLKLL